MWPAYLFTPYAWGIFHGLPKGGKTAQDFEGNQRVIMLRSLRDIRKHQNIGCPAALKIQKRRVRGFSHKSPRLDLVLQPGPELQKVLTWHLPGANEVT